MAVSISIFPCLPQKCLSFKFWETKSNENSLYCFVSLMDSPNQKREGRFPVLGTRFLLDSLWLIRDHSPKWYLFLYVHAHTYNSYVLSEYKMCFAMPFSIIFDVLYPTPHLSPLVSLSLPHYQINFSPYFFHFYLLVTVFYFWPFYISFTPSPPLFSPCTLS